MTFAIENPETDREAARLLEKVLGSITPWWRVHLPPVIKVRIAGGALADLPELAEFWAAQKLERSREEAVHIVCPEFDEREALLLAHYDARGAVGSQAYYFKKEAYAVIGKLAWVYSERLRVTAAEHATGFARLTENALYVAFRDTFSRFFLNPEWLADRKPDAWAFIGKMDKLLQAEACR